MVRSATGPRVAKELLPPLNGCSTELLQPFVGAGCVYLGRVMKQIFLGLDTRAGLGYFASEASLSGILPSTPFQPPRHGGGGWWVET